ncbi:MAG: peptidylprolyl isomerase [Woeseiaceae bacterium]|nr:peptidylprolyl isomerase [Woeseiaceae bacterium]
MRILIVLLSLTVAACGSPEAERPEILMQTSMGDIRVEIAADVAPLTGANFLRLAEGGHLDGAGFYRVVRPDNDNGTPPISVIQGGVQDRGSPFAPVPHETTERTGLTHVDGAISMARGGVGTASTEFFICLGEQPALDFGGERNADGQGFAVFGRVVSGMDVVRRIHALDADALTSNPYLAGQVLSNPVVIESVSIVD